MGSPSLGELLDSTNKRSAKKQRGPVPGVVVSYDRTKQVCSARPLVSPKGAPIDGVIESIPVLFPRGGGISIAWDLAEGDPVTLIPCEPDISRWHIRGLDGAAPSVRRFSLADCIAIPGASSIPDAISADGVAAGALVVQSDDIRLGSSAASDPVALSSLVLDRLQTIVNWLNTHGHPPPFGSPPATPIYPTGVPPVAATKAKAE